MTENDLQLCTFCSETNLDLPYSIFDQTMRYEGIRLPFTKTVARNDRNEASTIAWETADGGTSSYNAR